MKKKSTNNIKLGVFVISGLFVLVLALFMIGRNRNLFGSNAVLRVHFNHVHGLIPGNNVRYAGIEVGTVRGIKILNDTLLEVTMSIKDAMMGFIPANSIVTIGTDGLMGNKVINIEASGTPSGPAKENDLLTGRKNVDTDAMLRTLAETNEQVALIADNLKQAVVRLNNSAGFWELLTDKSFSADLQVSARHIHAASINTEYATEMLTALLQDVKKGKGLLGIALADTQAAHALAGAIFEIKKVGTNANELADVFDAIGKELRSDLSDGNGVVRALLKDSQMVIKLENSLGNIEKGTQSFNENMEALKTNFLFRGYFRRLEKKAIRERAKNDIPQN